jgi:hypothetical protein
MIIDFNRFRKLIEFKVIWYKILFENDNVKKNTKCYAVELCELWEIVNEVRRILSECQVFRGIVLNLFQGNANRW